MELVIPPVQNTSHIESILFLISPVIIVSCSFIRKEQRSSAECYFHIHIIYTIFDCERDDALAFLLMSIPCLFEYTKF